MKKGLIAFLVFVVAFLAGAALAFNSLRSIVGDKDFVIQNGPWKVNKSMSLEDRYQRSMIALGGLFALRESEVLYFVADSDSEGRPLSSEYEYVLEGPATEARYWSYTLYGQDFYLVKNEANRFGFNLDNLEYEKAKEGGFALELETGRHQVHISREEVGKNWLPSGNEDQFYINLRMYNPSPAVYKNLSTVQLPTIKRLP